MRQFVLQFAMLNWRTNRLYQLQNIYLADPGQGDAAGGCCGFG